MKLVFHGGLSPASGLVQMFRFILILFEKQKKSQTMRKVEINNAANIRMEM